METRTWHYGLVADWWANFNTDGPEIVYFRERIADAQPILDAGCGTGRLLVPWLEAGLDVDGCDASADMIAHCRRRAAEAGHEPTLWVQALHELDPPRRYRSIVVCGAFGLGSTREQDEEALGRLRAFLEPGGMLLLDNGVPYSNENMWPRWTKSGRDALPSDWRPAEPEWRAAGDGSEYSLQGQVLSFDPLDQSAQLVLRAQRRAGDDVVVEEHRLSLRNYFRNELLLMLQGAGFESVRVEAGYTGAEPTADDDFLVFNARG